MMKTDYTSLLESWGSQIPRELLVQALTHRSYAYEQDVPHNERLEFIGDSILGMVVATDLYRDYPEYSEGDLSKIKSAAVSERALAIVARELDLGSYIYLGHGEELTGGRDKDSILSDTVEALIAATFLANGLEVAIETTRRHIAPMVIEATKMGPALDWRTAAEVKAREIGLTGDLRYETSSEGPDHARIYTTTVFMGERELGTGSSTSIKAAKLEACKNAFLAMEQTTTSEHA